MNRGLVIGKFMPLHKGHIALIDFASARSDQVIVSMSYTETDPIDPLLRLQWIKEQFKNNPKVQVYLIKDDFDNESLPLNERTAVWAQKMQQVYPPVDCLFSSEEYGEPFSKNLGVKHILFDRERTVVHVSATDIRNKPFSYWHFIPDHIRPFFVKKICFYGPESTGKSTMAQRMAAYFKTEYVPEAAREILKSNEFTTKEITDIGYAQHQSIQDKLLTANKLLFCDTDAITTAIYSNYYLGNVPPAIAELEKKTVYSHYFLLATDTEWVPDPLRDLGHLRKEMMRIFEDELIKRNIAYTIITGTYEEREQKILNYINQMVGEL